MPCHGRLSHLSSLPSSSVLPSKPTPHPRGPPSARLFIPPGSVLSYTLQTRRAPFTQHNNPLCPWHGTPLLHSSAQRHLSATRPFICKHTPLSITNPPMRSTLVHLEHIPLPIPPTQSTRHNATLHTLKPTTCSADNTIFGRQLI